MRSLLASQGVFVNALRSNESAFVCLRSVLQRILTIFDRPGGEGQEQTGVHGNKRRYSLAPIRGQDSFGAM